MTTKENAKSIWLMHMAEIHGAEEATYIWSILSNTQRCQIYTDKGVFN